MLGTSHILAKPFYGRVARRNNGVLIALLLALAIPFCVSSLALADCGGNASQTLPGNVGTEFLICFEQNIDNSPAIDVTTGGYLELYVATLGDSATITVTSRRYPTLDKIISLPAHSSYTYRISDSTVQAGLGVTDTMGDLWMTSSETPDDRVVMVRASMPVVCYALDYKQFSADAVCALPANSAGTDYRVMSYQNSTNVGPEPENEGSQFAVAAFEDNTTVTITPTVATLGGHPAGVPFTISLLQGQGVQVQTDPNIPGLDLTGSIVSADHPIVVYGSHARTEMPRGFLRPDGDVSRDMLLESMPPTSTWGKDFVLDAVANSSSGTFNPNGDVVRVLALNPNTTVSFNGGIWTTLGAGGFEDTAVHGPTLIQSTGPLLVGEYMHSDFTQNGNGDPFLAIVPPVEQTYNNFTFFLPSNADGFNTQFVTIATDVASEGQITLDGQLLPSSLFTPIAGSVGGRSFAVLEDNITGPGVHSISTMMPAAQGFTILGFGLGDVVSYGYTAGSLLVPQRTIAIDPPPEAMGGQHGNWLDFRNTSFQPAYLDSAVFVPDQGYGGYGVHSQENIAYDIQTLDVGQGARIHLVSDLPLSEPVKGTAKIYGHTADFTGLEPATIPFTLYPNASSSVTPNNSGTLAITAYASPNPFSAFTTINFSIPASGDVTMTLYDELGRVVQHISSGELNSGAYAVRVERRGLATGFYTCEIVSRKLNIDQRVPIVAGE